MSSASSNHQPPPGGGSGREKAVPPGTSPRVSKRTSLGFSFSLFGGLPNGFGGSGGNSNGTNVKNNQDSGAAQADRATIEPPTPSDYSLAQEPQDYFSSQPNASDPSVKLAAGLAAVAVTDGAGGAAYPATPPIPIPSSNRRGSTAPQTDDVRIDDDENPRPRHRILPLFSSSKGSSRTRKGSSTDDPPVSPRAGAGLAVSPVPAAGVPYTNGAPASPSLLKIEKSQASPTSPTVGAGASQLSAALSQPGGHTAKRGAVFTLGERGIANSSRIVHAFGASGIAPLAPLSQKKDEKTVIPVMLSWTGGGRTVHVTGTFNNWRQKIRLTKSKTDFTTVVDMPAGTTHRFKFIVDDEWKCSEDLPMATDSEGNLVNYLDVMDEKGDTMGDGLDGLSYEGSAGPSTLSESPPSTYTSKIPGYLNWHLQPPPTSLTGVAASFRPEPPPLPNEPPPPHLPPHLERVLLNAPQADIGSRDDNTVLGLPHPVTINHLYACRIRDGVMALASTTRYRSKYVTTILYKPVAV